jgi:uncharacterized protein (DUF3820 family)
MATHTIRNPNIVATPLDHRNDKKKSQRIRKKKAKLNSTDLLTAVMPTGKYRGWFITELPVDYLQWASKNLTGSVQGLCSQALKRRLGFRP